MPLYLPQFNLQHLNTLAAPAIAQVYVSVNSAADLKAALVFAREQQLPILILGGGSNIVLRDHFAGCVIHIQFKGVEKVGETSDSYLIKAQAGEVWDDFVSYCLDHEYWGLENLSLIPGTVGAAPVQNIGAYGVELQDVFYELTALDIKSGVEVTFTRDSCQFGYRDSVFKNALKDQFVILSVTFQLLKSPKVKAEYPALKQALSRYSIDDLTPELVAKAVCDVRQSKLPDPRNIPNVGSFFHNPVVSQEQYQSLTERFPDIVAYPSQTGVKLAAGWLIDKAGWKGFLDDVGVHDQQALVLINPNRLMGDKVLALATRIKSDVFDQFGVALHEEPRVYP